MTPGLSAGVAILFSVMSNPELSGPTSGAPLERRLAPIEEARDGLIDDLWVCDRAHMTHSTELDNLYLRQRPREQPSDAAR